MYGWIWAHLPGPLPVRLLLAVLVLLAVLALLWTQVFPALEEAVPFTDVTVDEPGSGFRTEP